MLLAKTYDATEAALVAVTDWDVPSPCDGWTVRDVVNHLVSVMRVFAAAVDGGDADEYAGDDPAGAYRAAADRCLAVFTDPEVLAAPHPFPFGPTPGAVIAGISRSESLVHGWDIARGAGVPYAPPPEVVAELLAEPAGEPPAPDMYAPPVTPADDQPLTVLLARLGRVA